MRSVLIAVLLLIGSALVIRAVLQRPQAEQKGSAAPALPTPTQAPMAEDVFWALVDEARASAGADDEAFLEGIRHRLTRMGASETVAFKRRFEDLQLSSYGWPLWGAAYVINGGCSDDCFDYFRAWLISQGRAVHEAAVAAPDSLAEVEVAGDADLESFLYVPAEVYEALTQRPLPEAAYGNRSRPELGDGWDFDDEAEMRARYPKLVERHW